MCLKKSYIENQLTSTLHSLQHAVKRTIDNFRSFKSLYLRNIWVKTSDLIKMGLPV